MGQEAGSQSQVLFLGTLLVETVSHWDAEQPIRLAWLATLSPRHPPCFLSPQYWNFNPYLAFCLGSWPQSQVLMHTRQAFYQLSHPPACCFFLSLCSYGQVFAKHCCLTELSYFDKLLDIMLYKRKRGLPKQSPLTWGFMSTTLRGNTFTSVCGKELYGPVV